MVLYNFMSRAPRGVLWPSPGKTPPRDTPSPVPYLGSMPDGSTLQPIPTLRFVLLVLVWLIPGLIGHHPWKPDEGYTFGLVRHIAATGDWIVPMLGNEPFLEKPPLYFVVAAVCLELFGGLLNEHDAARLASGLFMLLACAGVATGANAAIGRHAGRWAVVIFLGCIGLPVRAHQMITDTALLAGVSLGMAGLVLLTRYRLAAGPLLGAGAAMTFMAKGLLGPGMLTIAALIVSACLLVRGKGEGVASRLLIRLGAAMLFFLPLPMYWTITLWRETPDFFETWWFVNNVGRFTGDNDIGPPADTAFYFRILPWYAFPALPLALCIGRARSRHALASPIGSVAILAVVIVTVLSIAADARELYALPVLAPLAVLAAAGLLRLDAGADFRLARIASGLGRVSACLAVFLVTGTCWIVWMLLQGDLSLLASPIREPLAPLLDGIAPGTRDVLIAAACAGLVALIVTALWLKRPGAAVSRLVYGWTLLLTLLWGMAMTLCLPWIDASKRYAEVWATLAPGFVAAHAEGSCVATLSLDEAQRALMPYYLWGTRTLRIETMPEAQTCRWLLFQGAATPIPMTLYEHRPVIEAYRPSNQSGERFLLYRLPLEVGALAH